MNSTRYKTLLSYLPGMASVVNSFQSEQVQLAVFDRLISALEEKTEMAEPVSASKAGKSSGGRASSSSDPGSIELDIVEGDSIHADLESGL